MRRRDFLALSIGGFASAVSPPVLGQNALRKRVGFLTNSNEADGNTVQRISLLEQALAERGWVKGRTLEVSYRFGGGGTTFPESLARGLIDEHPDVLVSAATFASVTLAKLTKSIPIVFIGASDPVGDGLVPNFAHPGGNVTGFTNVENTLGEKLLEILLEIAPDVRRVALMTNPDVAAGHGRFFWEPFARAAAAVGIEPVSIEVRTIADIDLSVAALASTAKSGLLVSSDQFTLVNRAAVAAAAARYLLPAVYPYAEFVADGGIISYGVDLFDLWPRAGRYVARILDGEKPGDLPVQAPTRYQLAVNLKVARDLGITIPVSLLSRADQVTE